MPGYSPSFWVSIASKPLVWALLAGCCGWAIISAAAEPIPAEARKAPESVGDFALTDFRGKKWSAAEFADRQVVVLAFLGTECPLVAKYGGRLQQLQNQHAASGLAVLGIFSNQQDSLAEIAQFAKNNKVEFPCLKDAGNTLADAAGATRTPEVVVLGPLKAGKRPIVYSGRIDDQFTYGKERPKAQHDYLGDALAAVLAGKSPPVKHAEPVGCLIGKQLPPTGDQSVTYSNQISRILQKSCIECHRPGEIGPFSLTSYEETVGWAEMIAEVTANNTMPPWHANPQHGKFRNDVRLSAEDKSLLARWVEAGAPEGDKNQLPPPREFVDGWRIGKPDLVLHMADKPFTVPAQGEVRYQFFMVDPGFTEDKWIKAAECRPGNRAVVHHIIIGLQGPGARRERVAGAVHSEWLTATAPGARPLILDDGHAKLIPAGSKLIFQMHYTPNGTVQQDRSSVGLIFADPKEVKHQVGTDKADNHGLRIPPGAENHKVEALQVFSRDMKLLALFPHMHLRGKAFRYTAVFPNGKEEVLLDIPHYDFNWQNSYEFADPVVMPAGSRLRCEAWYDNSDGNPANPNPADTVRWGDQTWEEMMIGYFDATPAQGELKLAGLRKDEFISLAQSGKARWSDALLKAAPQALSSDAKLLELGGEARKTLPQLDRICWTTLSGAKLNVERCAQEADIAKLVGGSGKGVPVALSTIATYAAKTSPVVNPKLADVRGPDAQFMARAFSSSVHIPFKQGEVSGVLNFWSTEPNAFPPEAVALLKELAEKMHAAK